MIEVFMQKEIISILLCVVIVLSFVSCTADNDLRTDTALNPVDHDAASGTDANENVCTLVIDCSAVFDHPDDLDPSVAEYLPEDGMIFSRSTVSIEPGETAAHLLRRICDGHGIPLETSGAGASIYVQGIGHLYEFDCGNGSGWMYRVNGDFPNYGCGSCLISPGDVIEWIYTCDLGEDVGDNYQDTFH